MLSDIFTLAAGVLIALVVHSAVTTYVTHLLYRRVRRQAEQRRPDYEAALREFERQVADSGDGTGTA